MTTRSKTFLYPACLSLAVVAAIAAFAAVAAAQTPQHIEARLRGTQEVPAISSTGHAFFQATINSSGEDATEIAWTMDYAGFSNSITQSHIHFAEPGVNGGIMIFFCSNIFNGPPGTPTCPQGSGHLEGTITSADVGAGAAAQGIGAGQFIKVLRAIRAGVSYANIHSTVFPAGEIRGQISVVTP